MFNGIGGWILKKGEWREKNTKRRLPSRKNCFNTIILYFKKLEHVPSKNAKILSWVSFHVCLKICHWFLAARSILKTWFQTMLHACSFIFFVVLCFSSDQEKFHGNTSFVLSFFLQIAKIWNTPKNSGIAEVIWNKF